MTAPFRKRAEARTVRVSPVGIDEREKWLKAESGGVAEWVRTSGFKARQGEISLVAGSSGALDRVLVGVGSSDDIWNYAGLPARLPAGSYRIDAEMDAAAATSAALGWALGSYRFERYKTKKGADLASLVWPSGADRARVLATAEAVNLVRDLINTPAADMGPSHLAAEARKLGRRFDAQVKVISGDALLKRNYPTIHAVGRASDDPPRLIDLRWGSSDAPKVTLVGKGVCFDSGGLDIKPASGMLRMKKDMGGGAHVLGLAQLIMALEIPVRLRALVPAVENSIAGNAYRPLDVIKTRKGIAVEVGNTDAEGRLILCDALAEADAEDPDLVVDFTTLTGAARVALGGELPALFANKDELADALLEAGEAVNDPMWRLPLWKPYRRLLDSKVADINNVSEGGMGGAITAALYLQEFVDDATPWAHFDISAWNASDRPGRPVGGEAQGLRAVFEMIDGCFGRRRSIEEILAYLNAERVRCTYEAVSEAIGVPMQSVGRRLGKKRKEASWVVNGGTGEPTDYASEQIHPQLKEKTRIIKTGAELKKCMCTWTEKK